jgi:V/A-type H+/Na+-transporting ATPase subunit F
LRFFVIGDEETVSGFRLAGVDGEVVNGTEQAIDGLNRAMKTDGIGVVLITERVAQTIRTEVDRHVYKTSLPLILEIPDAQGNLEGRGGVREMIRSAVGIHL